MAKDDKDRTGDNGRQTIGFGIDIGGSGTKGAKVDLTTGEFFGEST